MSKNNLGIIFDCDGTLLDSMAVWHSLDDRLATRAGVIFTKEDRDFLTSGTIEECARYMHETYDIGDSTHDVVNIIHEDMYSFYAQDCRSKPGAMAFVEEAHELGIPMAVASSTPPRLLHAGLEVTGLAPYMRAIVSVEDVGSSKREPLVYDVAREALGTTRATTWGFEDAVYALATLRAAGYRTVGIFDSVIAGSPSALESASDCFIMSFNDITASGFVEIAERNGRGINGEQGQIA